MTGSGAEPNERECPSCGADRDSLLVDPRPHPESNRHICCACDHEWTADPEVRTDGGTRTTDPPLCECDDPERDEVGAGPITFTVCTECSGVVR